MPQSRSHSTSAHCPEKLPFFPGYCVSPHILEDPHDNSARFKNSPNRRIATTRRGFTLRIICVDWLARVTWEAEVG
jgi:hypothetical protein